MPPARRKAPAAVTTARRSAEPDAIAPPKPTSEPAAAEPAPQAPTARKPSGKKSQSINWDAQTLARAQAAVTYLVAYRPEAGVRSLASLVNDSVLAKLIELERDYNDGKEFPRVAQMRTGRPAST